VSFQRFLALLRRFVTPGTLARQNNVLRAAVAALVMPLAVCVGCGDDDPDAEVMRPAATTAATTPEPAAPAVKRGTKIVLGDSQFGKILFDSKRQAIYLFDRETTKRARCYGECAQAWPPVYAKGEPRLGPGLKRSLLGTTKRRDGRRQITYGGQPLYYYAHEGAGQVLCHDIFEYGGLWLVVKRNGDPVPSSR
jgi:predicted lipoprotein with Yx(FWY)xxD motif